MCRGWGVGCYELWSALRATRASVGNSVELESKITIKIKIKEPLNWLLSLDSYGFRELKGGKLVDIQFPASPKLTKPWPLDVDGLALTPAAIEGGAEPARVTFRKYEEKEFDDLNLILPAII